MCGPHPLELFLALGLGLVWQLLRFDEVAVALDLLVDVVGVTELFLDLLRQIITESADTVKHIRTDLARGDQEAVTSRLHSFRGALGLVGAEELTRRALALEESIRNNLPDSASLLDALEREFTTLTQAIRPWREDI